MAESIDLTPSPRVLRMLGEIDFKAWQCLCEIIDNSIDSFSRTDFSNDSQKPKVTIRLPSSSQNKMKANDYLVVEDNGAGMTYEELNKSLKAGFSGNNPIDKMGLFGMGFNISTARLGHRTEITTSTKESDELLRVTIDFQDLENNGHFEAPVERIPKKADEINRHGTTVRITKLRTDHLKPLFQKKKILEKIGKIYGRIIREKDIKIIYAGNICKPFKHCTWSEFRNGQTRDGSVPAIIKIDKLIDEKKYCSTCWLWMSDSDSTCPGCNESNSVKKRERRVTGWVGIQRYFDSDHYGIDLIRNGRVITELDKSFFYWTNREQEEELEYPVDGHQRLGRIVGEIEIDFVKVTHQKDAFDKNTQDWRDVSLVIRGDGPIRPNIAKNQGYAINRSPLARLFSAFRNAKGGVKNLVPQRSNGQAMITDSMIEDLLRRFKSGESDYQSDEKWWELLIEGGSKSNRKKENDPTGGNPFAEEDSEDNDSTDTKKNNDKQKYDEHETPNPDTQPDMELSGNYSINLFKNVAIRVVAEKATNGTSENGFNVRLKGAELHFTYWPSSPIFGKTLLTPADFLVNELAYHMHSTAQNEISQVPLSAVEISLREKYFADAMPSLEEIQRQTTLFIEDLTDHLKSRADSFSFDLSPLTSEQLEELKTRLIKNQYINEDLAEQAIERGQFFSHAPFSTIKKIILHQPECIFDGNFFNLKFLENDNGQLKALLTKELEILMIDISWFVETNQNPENENWRGKIKRLIGSLEIINNWRV
ncbi:ATP-binding protein [Microbulbifer agarilyticus]|uniref:ATP-binding protein n=1 Tax=Microbulbifer agarilyticus TaxID=260552 RepID=UPI001CD24054|nr:ATP-binding protein [Microbulbifer agarilyticus]MCA0893285.1 ATP-binding protein [Microbulbifer agarilyticus]